VTPSAHSQTWTMPVVREKDAGVGLSAQRAGEIVQRRVRRTAVAGVASSPWRGRAGREAVRNAGASAARQAGRRVQAAARLRTWMRMCSDGRQCGQRSIHPAGSEPSHAGRAPGSRLPWTSRSRPSPEKPAVGPAPRHPGGPVRPTPATRSPGGAESVGAGAGRSSWPGYHKPATQPTQPWSRVHAPCRVASGTLDARYAALRRRNVRTFI